MTIFRRSERGYREDRQDGGDPRPDSDPGLNAGSLSYWASDGTSPPDQDPRPGVDTIVAWKGAGLSKRDGKWQFSGYGGRTYDIEAVAECAAGRDHKAPDPKCDCGFYAVPANDHRLYSTGLLLEVELYGRVMEGERGYRAEKMRVLSATAKDLSTFFRPRCYLAPNHSAYSWSSTEEGPEPCSGHAEYVCAKNGRAACALHMLNDPYNRYREWTWDESQVEQIKRDLLTEWRVA